MILNILKIPTSKIITSSWLSIKKKSAIQYGNQSGAKLNEVISSIRYTTYSYIQASRWAQHFMAFGTAAPFQSINPYCNETMERNIHIFTDQNQSWSGNEMHLAIISSFRFIRCKILQKSLRCDSCNWNLSKAFDFVLQFLSYYFMHQNLKKKNRLKRMRD